ncbi:polyhydroxyalkanoic acid system protein, partial [Arthrobacter stackebrandtii]
MPVGRGGHNANYVYIFRNARMTQISVERKHSLGRDA